MAVDAIAGAVAPDRPVTVINNVGTGTGDPSDIPATTAVAQPQPQGPNVWGDVGVGLLAAAAAWFTFGRRLKDMNRH